MKTAQEMFDIAFLGLARQGFLRSGEGSKKEFDCLYRGPEGMKCAIGHLIPDDRYEPGLEGRTVGLDLLRVADLPLDLLLFALRLQESHDNSEAPKIMESRLRALAAEYGLDVPDLPSPIALKLIDLNRRHAAEVSSMAGHLMLCVAVALSLASFAAVAAWQTHREAVAWRLEARV